MVQLLQKTGKGEEIDQFGFYVAWFIPWDEAHYNPFSLSYRVSIPYAKRVIERDGLQETIEVRLDPYFQRDDGSHELIYPNTPIEPLQPILKDMLDKAIESRQAWSREFTGGAYLKVA